MSEKKKGFLKGLFGKNSSGCGCGVTIVEEPKKKENSGEGKKAEQKK